MRLPSRRSKYGNKKVNEDGITFDSMKEWRRYRELKLLVAAKQIVGLAVHERFPLIVNRLLIGRYISDFSYFRHRKDDESIRVVEDVKGVKTAVYHLKKKLMKAIYDIDIKET